MAEPGHGILTLRFYLPPTLTDNIVTLRPAGLTDALFLHAGFSSKDFLLANGLTQPAIRSWFSFWWWLRKTFVFSYCIILNERPCGFLGLHSLQPGDCGEISLAIFDREMRRRHIGSRAFQLFAVSLDKHALVNRLLARVRQDNEAALDFWRNLGFVDLGKNESVIVLAWQQPLFTASLKRCSDK